jgi:GT2 family glycosyltransferase
MKDRDKPLVSVILLNYNGLDYIKKTLPRLESLDYPNYEIVIVDNASTDGSLNYLEENFSGRVIKNSINYGYSKGKNIGVSNANGEYILLLDNDILIHDSDIIERLLSAIKEKSIIHITLIDTGKSSTQYCGLFYCTHGIKANMEEILLENILNYPNDLVEIGSITGAFMFMKKEIFCDLGGFDESQPFNLDDIDLGARAWVYGYKVFLYTKLFATHLGVGKVFDAQNYSERFKLLFSGHARSLMKNYSLKNVLKYFPFLFLFHFLKSIKYSFKKRSFLIFLSFINSILLFIKNFFSTIRERKVIQSKRIIKDDIFLKIKPPKFNQK